MGNTPERQDLAKEATEWASKCFENYNLNTTSLLILILSEELGIKVSELKPDAKFGDDLKADELEPVQIAFAIEEEFNLKISDHDFEKIVTVEDLVKYVDKQSTTPP